MSVNGRFRAPMLSAAGLAAWAAVEAVSWPLVPDAPLAAAAVGRPPRTAVALAAATTGGSVLGTIAGMSLARRGIVAPQPWTTPMMRAAVDEWLSDRGALGVAHQPLSGVPHKLFVAAAPRHGISAGSMVTATVAFRGARMSATALGVVGARAALSRAVVSNAPRYATSADRIAGRLVGLTAITGMAAALVGFLRRWGYRAHPDASHG